MLKDLVKLMWGNKDFGDNSGVYLRCGARNKTMRIGDADSLERYLAPSSARTEMRCYGCSHLGCGCWGPQKVIKG